MDSGFRFCPGPWLCLNLTQKKHQAGEEQGLPARPASPCPEFDKLFQSCFHGALSCRLIFKECRCCSPGLCKDPAHLGQAEEWRNRRQETQSGSH